MPRFRWRWRIGTLLLFIAIMALAWTVIRQSREIVGLRGELAQIQAEAETQRAVVEAQQADIRRLQKWDWYAAEAKRAFLKSGGQGGASVPEDGPESGEP